MSDVKSTIQAAYRPIDGHPKYRVGDDGTVWSWRKKRKEWKLLRPGTTRTGYKHVGLRTDGRRHRGYVHRIILQTFVGPCPDGMECRHLDGDKSNNRLENLAWGTKSENVRDAIRHGTWKRPTGSDGGRGKPGANRGSKHGNAKLTERDVREMRRLRAEGVKVSEIAVRFNLHVVYASKILNGRSWCWLSDE